MSRFTKYPLLLLVMLAAACSKSDTDPAGQGEGYLQVSLINDHIVNTKADTYIYGIKITTTGGEIAASYPDHTNLPPRITLPIGTYKVIAECGENPASGFDAPYYRGEKEVTITKNTTVSETILCTLANVKINVAFSQRIKDNFSDYTVSVSNDPDTPSADNSLIFTKNDESKTGYLKESTSIRWTIELTNLSGGQKTYSQVISGVKAKDHYTLNFDLQEAPSNGSSAVELDIDGSLNEIIHNYYINLETGAAPEVVGDGFEIANPLQFAQGDCAGANLLVTASTTFQSIVISHDNDALVALGIPKSFNIITISPEDAQAVNNAGISWGAGDLSTATTASVDFTGLANTLMVGNYAFNIRIIDGQWQVVDVPFNISVTEAQASGEVATGSSNPWAKFAYLTGSFSGFESTPADLTFQYRADGTAEWTTFAGQVSVSGDQFSAKVGGLNPQTKYYWRSYSAIAQGQEQYFTTDATGQLQNMGFENWNSKKYSLGGKLAYYPNADASNSYWGTGNDGLCNQSFLSKDSNTVPSDDVPAGIGSTKSAKLTSINGVTLVGFAAGNIFTGDYKTDMSTPENSVKFGRPYTSRPVKLKGWYKYTSKTIDTDTYRKKHQDTLGTPDKCHIYVSLENWQGASSRPANPVVIGYGELLSDQTVSSWTPFYFNIVYNDLVTKPTHVCLAATSSYLGGDFCGGAGSELFIDQFEFEFE